MSAVVLGAAFRREPEAGDSLMAWFLILLVLLSVSTASYTFILLLAPVVLVWPTASKSKRLLLVGSYVLLNIPIRPAWLFPKLWLLFILFFAVGLPFLRAIRIRWVLNHHCHCLCCFRRKPRSHGKRARTNQPVFADRLRQPSPILVIPRDLEFRALLPVYGRLHWAGGRAVCLVLVT